MRYFFGAGKIQGAFFFGSGSGKPLGKIGR
jgi:hypothetical protein